MLVSDSVFKKVYEDYLAENGNTIVDDSVNDSYIIPDEIIE